MIRGRANQLKCERVFFVEGAHPDEAENVYERLSGMIGKEIEITEYLSMVRDNGVPRHEIAYGRSALNRYAKSFTNIYFIICKATGAVKIGRADNVKKRMAELQVASPGELAVLSTFRAPSVFESVLHAIFSKSKIHGEWFSITDDLLDVADIGNTMNYIGVLGCCKKMLDSNKPLTIQMAKINM